MTQNALSPWSLARGPAAQPGKAGVVWASGEFEATLGLLNPNCPHPQHSRVFDPFHSLANLPEQGVFQRQERDRAKL